MKYKNSFWTKFQVILINLSPNLMPRKKNSASFFKQKYIGNKPPPNILAF